MSTDLGKADEVPDDQEVARELHLLDRLDLAIQPFAVLGEVVLQRARRAPCASRRGRRFSKPCRATYSKYVSMVCSAGTSNFGNGSLTFSSLTLHRWAMSHVRVSASGTSPNSFCISVERLHVELFGRESHPILVRHRLAGLDAEHDLVHARVVVMQIVRVVGGHQRDARVSRDSL